MAYVAVPPCYVMLMHLSPLTPSIMPILALRMPRLLSVTSFDFSCHFYSFGIYLTFYIRLSCLALSNGDIVGVTGEELRRHCLGSRRGGNSSTIS